MKSIVSRLIALILVLVSLCTYAMAEKNENPLFANEWKLISEITRHGKESSKIRGSVYAGFQFGETECIASSYMNDVPIMYVTYGCSIDGTRITLTMQNTPRSGSYTIENDTLTIAWDDGASLIFCRMPKS